MMGITRLIGETILLLHLAPLVSGIVNISSLVYSIVYRSASQGSHHLLLPPWLAGYLARASREHHSQYSREELC